MLINKFRAIFDGFLHPTPRPKPILPPELEREIFELAAISHPECAVRLVLVAHRTLIWLVPTLQLGAMYPKYLTLNRA
jgi:hypothetical protein